MYFAGTIEKFNLMGHSMGGMIVQEIAKISGDKINKLICFATGSIGDIPGRFEPIDTSIKRLNEEGVQKSLDRIPKFWFIKGKEDKNYYICENATKNIKNETLIIWADKDKSYNFEQVKTLEQNIPNSKLEVIEGFCHNVHLEAPQIFNEKLDSFLR